LVSGGTTLPSHSGKSSVSPPEEQRKNRGDLEKSLGYRFQNRELLEEALTHRSLRGSAHENTGCDYERLEFLGDAVIEMITREHLLDCFPTESEGQLTRRKIRLVCSDNLAAIGAGLDLGKHVRLGDGVTECPMSVISDVVESLIGAIYIDGGLQSAREAMLRTVLLPSLLDKGCQGDPKSRLQELLQARELGIPEYRIVSESGPDHNPLFECRVVGQGVLLGEGAGHSKRQAQQSAAIDALMRLEGEETDGLSAF
jgi:ribonuclease-3